MFIYILLAYFMGFFVGYQAVLSEKIPSDSAIMTEAILNPKEGLFIPQIFLVVEKLCSAKLKDALRNVNREDDAGILPILASCNRTVIETKGYLNFKDENTIKTLCSEEKMGSWKTCGELIAMGANNCLESVYGQSPSKGYNNWKFTHAFTRMFCKDHQYFTVKLLDGDNLVCSDPNNTQKIRECNDKALEYLNKDNVTDLNAFCTNFGIMEYCVNLIFNGDCHYAPTVSRLISALKKDLECDYFTMDSKAKIYVKKVKVQDATTRAYSKTSSLLPSSAHIVALMLSYAINFAILKFKNGIYK